MSSTRSTTISKQGVKPESHKPRHKIATYICDVTRSYVNVLITEEQDLL